MSAQTGFFRTAGGLVCDGVALASIAAAEGTPVYVYSAAVFRERYTAIDRAFGAYPHAIHYAFKANSTRALVSLLKAQGSCVDAVSMWEVEVARAAGFEPRQIVFDGEPTAITQDWFREIYGEDAVEVEIR